MRSNLRHALGVHGARATGAGTWGKGGIAGQSGPGGKAPVSGDAPLGAAQTLMRGCGYIPMRRVAVAART